MPTCSISTYCLSNTGNVSIDDTYDIQPGSYNSNSFYLGQVNGYYIYFSTRGYWCVSYDFEVGECLMSGSNPCFGDCPDLCDDYFTEGTCPEPTPPPVDPCDIFDFDAIFDCEVDVTPTPTPTVSPTQSITPTPSTTNSCPLYVDAVVLNYTPTPTITPTMTPTSSQPVVRDCGFSGDVTFNTIDTTIDCPYSVEFQDCYNGAKYYSSVNVNRIDGGSLEQFMVFQATVDGIINKCISYVGVNVNIIGNNSITLSSGLLGYSNVGDCLLCLRISPTPTPTLSQTPTPTPTETTNRIIPVTPSVSPSRIINYYLYRNCANTNQYICWAGVPFGTTSSWSIGSTFQTTSLDSSFPNTCWSLYSIGTSCNNQGVPSYQITTYTNNPFTSVNNSILSDCTKCTAGGTSVVDTTTPTCCCYSATGPSNRSSGTITFVNCGTEYGIPGQTVTVTIERYRVITFCAYSIVSTSYVTYTQQSNCTNCRDSQISPSSPANCIPPPQCKCLAFKNTSQFTSSQLPQVTYKKCSGQIVTVDVSPGVNLAHCDCVDLTYTIDNDNEIDVQECESGNPQGDCNAPTFVNSNRCCCQTTCGASGAVPSGAVLIPSCT